MPILSKTGTMIQLLYHWLSAFDIPDGQTSVGVSRHGFIEDRKCETADVLQFVYFQQN